MRAQAAMEFLMSYGAAIFVVLIAIASLAYFGVLDVGRLLPSSCTIEPGIACIDQRVTNRTVVLSLSNGKGEDITFTNITIAGCTGRASGTLDNGEQRSFSITGCDNDGNRFSSDVNLSYVSPSGIIHEIVGSINGKIEEGISTQRTLSFRDNGASVNTTYDTMISEDDPATNYGSLPFVNVDGAGPHAHGLLSFPNIIGNGENKVPLGAQIDSASVTIFCYNDGGTMNVYRLLEDWSETQATWNNRKTGTAWSQVGAEGASHDAEMISWNCPAPATYTYDVQSFVQKWVDGAANYGVVLLDTNLNGNDFTSKDDPIPAEKPMLTVTFTTFS